MSTNNTKVKPKDKIWFAEEKRPYTVKSCNERFVIGVKPFNLKHTYIYTIVDLQEGIRSSDSYIFGRYDYSKQSQCDECLLHLQSGETELSRRNQIPIKITRIKRVSKKA